MIVGMEKSVSSDDNLVNIVVKSHPSEVTSYDKVTPMRESGQSDWAKHDVLGETKYRRIVYNSSRM